MENSLKQFFLTPFNLLPIPDDAPDEIPRFLAGSPFGHSQFVATKNSFALMTRYDEQFSANWSQCASYLADRIAVLEQSVREIGAKVSYLGLVARIFWPDAFPSTTLRRSFLNTESDFYDVSIRFTELVDEEAFLNYTLSSVRSYPHAQSGLPNTGIECLVDLNTRYAVNMGQQPKLTTDELLQLIDTFVLTKLPTLLGGDVE